MKNNIYKIICIDAGHCDKFAGAQYKNGIQKEEVDNLRMALKVEEYLKSFGHTVYQTRRTGGYLDPKNKNTDLNARPAYANKVKSDYFISIHRNSLYSGSTGIETWIHSNADTFTTYIAKCIQAEVCAVSPVANRGVKKGYSGNPFANYAINRISTMPSCLLELLFISNPNDNKIYNDNFDQYAKAIAVGICKGLGCNSEPINSTPVKPVEPTKPVTPVKPQDERWKVEIYPLLKEDAKRLQKLFDNARSVPLHSDVLPRPDGTYKLSSFKYVTKQEADEVCQGIKLLTGCQCFVWEC